MHVAEFRPGHRDHLRGGVELHRARTQQDHGAIHRQVLVRERAQVAQHSVLAVVGVEHRVGQELRVRCNSAGISDGARRPARRSTGSRRRHEDAPQQFDVRRAWWFRPARCRWPSRLAQVDAHRARRDQRAVVAGPRLMGVERGFRGGRTRCCRAGAGRREDRGQAVRRARAMRISPSGPWNGVHRGHHRQQHLRGADVGGRLRGGCAVRASAGSGGRRLALGVDRHADQAARHRALEASRQAMNAACGPPKPNGTPKRCVTDDDVGAHLARRP